MGRKHLVGSKRHHLTSMINHVHYNREPVKFCEVFRLYYQLLSIQYDCLLSLSAAFQDYLLVLTAEAASHVLDLRKVLFPGTAQLSKFEVL